MAWGFDPGVLTAERDAALGWLGDDPSSGPLEIVGRLSRWLDEPEPAREYFRRAAADVETYMNGDGGGDPDSWGRQGGLLRLAGDEHGAREWLARARQGSDEVRNRGIVVALDYLLGDDESALRVAGGSDTGPALLAAARLERDPRRVDGAVTAFARDIRAARVLPGEDRLDHHLSRYDWLEEAFRLQAELSGEPMPDHRVLLARAGLAKVEASAAEPRLRQGRWTSGAASLEVPPRGLARFALDPERALVLEISGRAPQYDVRLSEHHTHLGDSGPAPSYTEAAVDLLRAHAPEAEPAFLALLDAARR